MTYYTPGGDNNPGGHGYLLFLIICGYLLFFIFVVCTLFIVGGVIGTALLQVLALKTVTGM